MKMQQVTLGTIAYLGGVPAVPEDFCWSWSQMVAYNREYLLDSHERIFYTRATTSFHVLARNMLAQTMQGDWLLMLDCDHVFEPDLAARLVMRMKRWNIDVLTGLYLYKEPPHTPVLFRGNEAEGIFRITGWDEHVQLLKVDSAGAGCLLVRRRVFERMVVELGEWPFDVRHRYTEDHSFFLRLQDLGIPAYCDPTVESYHLKAMPLVAGRFFDPTKPALGERPGDEVAPKPTVMAPKTLAKPQDSPGAMPTPAEPF